MAALKFSKQNQSDFAQVLRKRVNQYFKENEISRKANGFMYGKIWFYITGLAGSYAFLLLADNWILSMVAWVLVGLFSALSALNICHDAIHGSISKKPETNKFFSNIFNVLGANDYVWNFTHNIVHHSYTNVQGHDEDVDAIPFVRTSPHQPHKGYHRFQIFYAFLFYGLASITWVFIKDYVDMVQLITTGVLNIVGAYQLFSYIK